MSGTTQKDKAKDVEMKVPPSDMAERTREVTVTHGYGKNKFNEKVLTTLVGVPGLLSAIGLIPKVLRLIRLRKIMSPSP